MEVNLRDYPARVNFSHDLKKLLNERENRSGVSLVGRMMLDDQNQWSLYEDGFRLRINMNGSKPNINEGDYVVVRGNYFQEGEPYLVAEKIEPCSRSIVPPHVNENSEGLEGLELLTDQKKRENILLRSRMMKKIRSFLDDKDFVEVETPHLRYFPSASSKQMTTKSRINGHEYFLRGSPEKHILRLALSLPKFYEIEKCFRDGECDSIHSPEFTMLEFYSTFKDYKDMMGMTEELVEQTALETRGTTKLSFNGYEIDVKRPWKRVTVREAGIQGYNLDPIEASDSEIKRMLGINEDIPRDILLTRFIEERLERLFIQPTFLTNYPLGVGAPDKTDEFDRKTMERSEGFIAGGLELVNLGTLNNDPLFLRKHYAEHIERRYGPDKAREFLDEDFLLEVGSAIPPSACSGIGLDRLAMVLTGEKHINRVMCYPFKK